MYRSNQYRGRFAGGHGNTVTGAMPRGELEASEKTRLRVLYEKMGAEALRLELQRSGWHNVLGDPRIKAFARAWLSEHQERIEGRTRVRRAAAFISLLLLLAMAGYFL